MFVINNTETLKGTCHKEGLIDDHLLTTATTTNMNAGGCNIGKFLLVATKYKISIRKICEPTKDVID